MFLQLQYDTKTCKFNWIWFSDIGNKYRFFSLGAPLHTCDKLSMLIHVVLIIKWNEVYNNAVDE